VIVTVAQGGRTLPQLFKVEFSNESILIKCTNIPTMPDGPPTGRD
jgi:hypothetical protein